MSVFDVARFSPGMWFYDTNNQLRDFLYKRAEEAIDEGSRQRYKADTIEKIKDRQRYIRDEIEKSLGGIPDSSTPLLPVKTGELLFDGYRIEKIIFQSRPGAYVTGNLYIPDGIKDKTGAVLFLSGHHMMAKHEPEYQHVCQRLVKSGLVVLSQDPVGQGERLSYYDKTIKTTTIKWGTAEHDHAGAQCWALGDGIARYFVHDAMRGIDYLMTRPEVDPKRIGVTGNSGGGTQTCLMMLCDKRIAAAAPATFVMNRKTYMYAGGAQDAEQIWPGLTKAGIDHEDILFAMVPKPVLVLAVTYDFFPIEGVRQTVWNTKRFWEVFDKEENISLYEDETWHTYTENLAKAAAEFFTLHLLGKKAAQDDIKTEAIEPSRLWCTKNGQVAEEYDDAVFVLGENIKRIKELRKERASYTDDELRKRAYGWLKDRVFNDRRRHDLNCRFIPEIKEDDLYIKPVIWWSQEGLFNYALIFENHRNKDKNNPLTLVVSDSGTTRMIDHMHIIRKECENGNTVMMLDTTGVGNIAPNKTFTALESLAFYGVIFKFNHELMWRDDSLTALRTYDVIRALDFINEVLRKDAGNINVIAIGRQGIYAKLAAFLDDRIKHIKERDGFGSYEDFVSSMHYDNTDISSVILPGVLEYFDMPDIERWLGKRYSGQDQC